MWKTDEMLIIRLTFDLVWAVTKVEKVSKMSKTVFTLYWTKNIYGKVKFSMNVLPNPLLLFSVYFMCRYENGCLKWKQNRAFFCHFPRYKLYTSILYYYRKKQNRYCNWWTLSKKCIHIGIVSHIFVLNYLYQTIHT